MPRPPLQETRPPPTAIPTADAPLTPSKTQRKRDAHALQALGVQLVALSAAQLTRIDLPEALHEAVVAAQRIRARGAATADAVYWQADAAARSQCAQPHPRGIGARAGQDTTAPAVGPADTAHTGMRAHSRASYSTCFSRPVNRAWCRPRRVSGRLVLVPAQPIAPTWADSGRRG